VHIAGNRATTLTDLDARLKLHSTSGPYDSQGV